VYLNYILIAGIACVALAMVWLLVKKQARVWPLLGWAVAVLVAGYLGTWLFMFAAFGGLLFFAVPFFVGVSFFLASLVSATLVSGLWIETARIIPLKQLRKRNGANITAGAYGLLHAGLWLIVTCFYGVGQFPIWFLSVSLFVQIPVIAYWLLINLLITMIVWYGTCWERKRWLYPFALLLHMAVANTLLMLVNYDLAQTYLLPVSLFILSVLAVVALLMHRKYRHVKLPEEYVGDWFGPDAPKW
jgi:hypothetical protein